MKQVSICTLETSLLKNYKTMTDIMTNGHTDGQAKRKTGPTYKNVKSDVQIIELHLSFVFLQVVIFVRM